MSTHSTELVRGTHEFTVGGYSLQKRKGAGHSTSSGSFQIGGCNWVVLFYPSGYDDMENQGYVAMFLELQCTTAVDKVTTSMAVLEDRRLWSQLLRRIVRQGEEVLAPARYFAFHRYFIVSSKNIPYAEAEE
ncbi:hypothetical protein E2562_012890 [Oryza meyeriana var. granulata]|uniref:MATH domain-containing protein n=1 Tax=Oryza meyeriana var. granulata TaxID=110450 RepID=A0A6G1CFU6_9ORYZ|nr:hypothetical protein E2562_012890 [Oryza meyeriana var. granulata]